MKINTSEKKSQKKLVIIITVLIFLGAGGYIATAALNNLWPFYSQNQNDTDSFDSKNNSSSLDNSNENTHDSSDSKTQEETTSKPDNYVRPEISNPPTNSSSYPIENERYRIDQNSSSNYTVELYPIINNPNYSDYNTQLRDYKNEVLDYLKSRYGNIDNLKINWIPKDAENI